MATYSPTSATGKAVAHVNGVPPCGAALNDTQAGIEALRVAGGLFGAATLINVSSGTDYTVDAVALANFYQIGSNYSKTGSPLPDLTSASPPLSIVIAPDSFVYQSYWDVGTADAVSTVLMHDTLLNEFTLDPDTRSGTDWVVTLPTKRFYVANGSGNASQLFQRNFNASAGSCDDVTLNVWDREERTPAGPLNFSPAPPTPTSSLCWGANVITFNNSKVLGSANAANLQSPGFQNGWMALGFPTNIGSAAANVHRLVNDGMTSIILEGGSASGGHTTTYSGLPAIGFATVSFSNGTLTVGTPPVNVLSNYGGEFRHKTNTTVQ